MSALLTRVRTVVRHAARACATLSGLCFLAIFVTNIVHMVLRTFADGGFIWITDLSQLLLLWMVMLGTVAAYQAREHIVVDFLVARLGGTPEVAVAALTRAVELGLFAFLFQAGLEVAEVRSGIDYVQLGVPSSWGFAAIPVSAAMLLATALTLPLRYERPLALDDIEDASATPPEDGAHEPRS